jgi:methyl-accepting chemotaxis protein
VINNIRVGVKLVGSIALVCIITGALLLVERSIRITSLNKLDLVYRNYMGVVLDTGNLKNSFDKMEKNLYQYVAAPQARHNALTGINQEIDSVNRIIQVRKNQQITGEEQKLIADFEAAWPEVQQGYKNIMGLVNDGKKDEVAGLLADGNFMLTIQKKTLTAVNALNDYNTKRKETDVKTTKEHTGGTSYIVLMLIGLGLIPVSAIVYMLSVSITQPLKRGVLMMEELKRGHLSKRLHIERKDEIGLLANAMNQFADNLQQNVIFNMKQISEGNISIEPAIIDDMDEIGPALKNMVGTIRNLVKEMNTLTKSTLEGKLDIRGNEQDFKGAYQEIVCGVNQTLDAVIGPINEASTALENIAAKDMTVRVRGEYSGDHAKIKDSFNMAVENLDKALQQVAIGAGQVASASVQVSTSGQSLSQGASEQASSLEEISSSLQEMSSMTKQNTLHAREANGVASAARESAGKGVESMNRLSSAINQIKSSSDATARIVKTIDEIAFQTNLLALNAAVEAARAGDAGKGFAVVAEEVRNLAMRSAEAAKNTANLIEEAVRNSENGVSINSEVLKNFREITEKISKVSQVVAEIAAASEQQDLGINQVNKAVDQMNMLTQQNAASAEESASAAQQMSSQSEEMRSMVAGFRLTGSGDFHRALPGGS